MLAADAEALDDEPPSSLLRRASALPLTPIRYGVLRLSMLI